MEIVNNNISSRPKVKKINEKVILSEFEAGNNKFVNIAVDRCSISIAKELLDLFDYLRSNGLYITSQFLFGTGEHESENRKCAEKYFNGVNWPVTVIKQESLNGGYEWGTIISAISANNQNPVFENEKIIGNYFDDDYAEYFFFGGLMPDAKGQSNIFQSKQSFEILDRSLGKAGMNIHNVARTWFYLDDLLTWYDEFNSVRNSYFDSNNVFEKLIPASTGIGASNLDGGALLFGGYAIKQKQNKIKIEPVDSPLQCPASNYKSSFSRAVEINHPEYNHLIVSGTASITSEGRTAHIGNFIKQAALTLKVVNGILESRNMTWGNVTRGIAYFKNASDIGSFKTYCTENNIPELPLSLIKADICRDELLFEIEVDAVCVKKNN